METQPVSQASEPATFSGRLHTDGSVLKRGSVCWSKTRLSDVDTFGSQRQLGDCAFALESFAFWPEQATEVRSTVQKHREGHFTDCIGWSNKPRRRRGRGVRLVVDSNPAFDLSSPLLQEVEIDWKEESNDPHFKHFARSREDSKIVDVQGKSTVREETKTGKGKRWLDDLATRTGRVLRHLPRLSPEAMNTCKHLFSGAIAAAVARTSVAPMERVKIEYIIHNVQTSVPQTVSRILREESLGGFWKGNAVNILRTAPFKAVNFYAFDVYRKAFLAKKAQRDLTNWERIVAGAAAGATATVVCFPLDTVRTRLVARPDQFRGVGDCLYQIISKEGPSSLYRGLLPGIVSMAPAGAVFYGVYDVLRAHHLRSLRSRENFNTATKARSGSADSQREGSKLGTAQTELGTFRTLLYGGISGICAEATTYPLEVLRRQLQLQGARGVKFSLQETVQQVLQQGGVGAFYAGLLPSSMQVIPSAALSYYVYEVCKNLMSVT